MDALSRAGECAIHVAADTGFRRELKQKPDDVVVRTRRNGGREFEETWIGKRGSGSRVADVTDNQATLLGTTTKEGVGRAPEAERVEMAKGAAAPKLRGGGSTFSVVIGGARGSGNQGDKVDGNAMLPLSTTVNEGPK